MVSNGGSPRGDPEVAPADWSSGAASSPLASDDDTTAMHEGGIQDQGYALHEDGSPVAAPSAESSGSDVIHIDLTQRPPPLPVSGLALEQIVSMLPGDTYAISGSGIPMRTSLRPESRHRSPSASEAKTPETTSANGNPHNEPGADSEAADGSEIRPRGESMASTGQRGSRGDVANGNSGSSHVTFTYIPGLGLVPVVVHEDMASDDDQLGDDDVVVGAREQPAAGEAMEQAEDSSPKSSSASEVPSEISDTYSDIPTCDAVDPCEVLSAPPISSAKESELRGLVIPAEEPDSSDSLRDAKATRYNISEAQLQGIMEQAVHGLVFANAVFEESVSDTDEPESQPEYHPPRGSDAWGKYACSKVVPEKLLHASGDSTTGAAGVRTSASQGSIDAEDSETQSQDHTSSGVAPVHSEDTGNEDDLDEINSGIVDELDDSGGGGCEIDGPESMLGGLAASRLVHSTNGASLGGPDACVAMFPTPVTSAVFGGGQAPTRRATTEAAVPQPGAAIFSVLGAHANSVSSGTFPPRARYMSHNTTRTQDTASRGGESVSVPGPCNAGPEHSGDTGLSAGQVAAKSAAVSPAAASVAASSDAPLLSAAAPTKQQIGGSAMPTPFAGGLLGAGSAASGGSGGNLNSTLRMSGQSLSAIRQAAFRAEGQQQAKLMEERLGGGADTKGGQHLQSGHHASAVHLVNPFSTADHEASAAAGLTEITHEPILSGPHRVGRRGATSGSVFQGGYTSGDSGHKRSRPQTTRGEESGDLEDILRNRPIIQPRYPTGPKAKECSSDDTQQPEHEDTSGDTTAECAPFPGAGEEGTGPGLRPRHRRSVDLVDLDLLAANEAAMQGAGLEDTFSSGPAEAHPNVSHHVRSLKATRESTDGQLPPPVATKSPRLHEDVDVVSTSSGSSTAHSVADERLVDELEALREELGQKSTLVAGLRGELRKYTDLAMRLEHQLNELRAQAADGGAAGKGTGRTRTQSDAGAGEQKAIGNGSAAAGETGCDGSCRQQQPSDGEPVKLADKPPGTAGANTVPAAQPSNTPAPAASATAQPGVMHTLPPHPQSQGLDTLARLVLYKDILSKAQVQVGRSTGPAPPDLRDAQDLLQGKEKLDAGMEKVMLIKLEKLVSWGCEAAWKASAAQQQVRYLEQAAQQAAQARAAVEAERDQLRRALEEAMNSKRRQCEEEEGSSSELRRQLGAAQDEAAMARAQASNLEVAVASLNADVRKLRGQLRSRDGSAEQPSVGAAAPGAAAAARADAMAWNMERQMLLKTINALEQELAQARAAAEGAVSSENPVDSEEAARKTAIAEAALARVQQLEAEKDVATAECAQLRQKLGEAVDAAAAKSASSTQDTDALQVALERAQQELHAVAALREELQRAAEAAAAQQEEECVMLRTQVVELRRELAMTAAAEAAADARQDEVEDELVEATRSVAVKDALIDELRQQLMAIGVEAQELRAEAEAARMTAHTEAQLQRKLSYKIEALQTQVELQAKAAAASIEDLEQALQNTLQERDSIQEILQATSSEVDLTKAELAGMHSMLSQLQAEASTAHSQVAELQEALSHLKKERDEAEARAAEAESLAAASQNRASDAQASSSLAESTLTEIIEEVEVLKARGSVQEAEVGIARAQVDEERLRAESAGAALAAARAELHELHTAVARLEVEGRDLRTALSAEDDLQLHLRGQVECLESELAQACGLAQSQGGTTPTATTETEREEGEGGELEEEAAATERTQELQERMFVLQQQLTEAMQLCEAATGQVAELQEQLAEAVGQRVVLGRTLEDTTAQLEAAQLLLAARGAAVRGAAGTSPREKPHRQVHEASSQVDMLLAEKALLMEDCSRLQAEVERLQASRVDAGVEAGKDAAEARVVALQEELLAAQSELKQVRSELGAANVELAVKWELLAVKDRSLASLQESVNALKVALQVAQQSVQAPSPSKSPGPEVAAATASEVMDVNMARYHDTVTALQSKFADSECTIRRLEQQVAALETRLSSDEIPSASPKPSDNTEADVRSKDVQATEAVRSHTPSSTPAPPRFSSVGGALSAPNIHELQLQIMQWRALGEDLHARYQSKKETLRRLREQLATEQRRHADDRGRWHAQLEAAQQRLGRMAADLGTALRRCIVLDLQPLSTTSLTTSPRTQLGGSDVAEDINTLANLLARQATALIESLEAALDQVSSAREERALLSAQLAHRQAVFDELRQHLTRRESREAEAALDMVMPSTLSCPSSLPYNTWAGASLQQGSYSSPKAGQPQQFAANPLPHSDGAHTSTAVAGLHRSPPAAVTAPPGTRGLSPFKSLQAATLNLSHDMAALSAQQAGLRQTLHAVEQRQSPYGKPRALSYVAIGSCSGGSSPNTSVPPAYRTGMSPRASPRPSHGQLAESMAAMHGRPGAGLHPLPTDANSTKHSPRMGHGLYQSPSSTHAVYEFGTAPSAGLSGAAPARAQASRSVGMPSAVSGNISRSPGGVADSPGTTGSAASMSANSSERRAKLAGSGYV